MFAYKLSRYNIDKYDFKSHFLKIFNCDDLSKLHEKYILTKKFNMTNNSDTVFHDKFYNNMRNDEYFINLYECFINEYVTTLFDEKFVFQKSPTLRIHFVNNWATPEFHTDTQDGYSHPTGEINFILPLTTCYDTNSVWIETVPKKDEFISATMQYGDLLQFSGGEQKHGNKINETAHTRVSFDFRVLPLSKYDPNYSKTSATTKTKFIVGGYYKRLK